MSRARLSSSPCCYRAVLPRVTACCSTSFFSRSLRWTSVAAKPQIPGPSTAPCRAAKSRGTVSQVRGNVADVAVR